MNPRAPSLVLIAALSALPALAQKPEVRLNVGSSPGASTADAPQIAAAGSSVYVVWQDRRNGGIADIYFNRSLDNGATWLPTDVRVDVGKAPGSSYSFNPQIAASGQAVFVVWEDMRNVTGYDIYCNRSLDGGATWLAADVRLDTGTAPGAAQSGQAQIAAAGSSVYVVWQDRRNGGIADIYFNRSLDNGTTWLPADVRLDTGSAPGSSASEEPQIAAAGSSVYVTWSDERNSATNGDIYFNRSSDGGLTWLPVDVRLDVGSSPGLSDSVAPRIAASGASVYVTWFESGPPAVGVHYNRSLDAGLTWLNDVALGGATAGPSIAATGASVFLAWHDFRNGSHADIYVNRSLDQGMTWLANDVRLDAGSPPSTYTSNNPRILASGNLVQVVWEEYRSTVTPRVYSNRSVDGGLTWLPTDVRLDRSSNVALLAGAFAPRLAASGASVYVTWYDQRTGGSDVYFALASGYQPYGSGTPGTNTITPLLSGSGNAAVGAIISLDFSNGLGGAPGLLAIGLGTSTQIAQPLLGGTLLVQQAATVLFLLGGGVGAPGAGSQSISVPVPNNLNLLGLDANFQGLFLDNGAALGVSMSNAIAAWIG